MIIDAQEIKQLKKLYNTFLIHQEYVVQIYFLENTNYQN